MNQIRGVWRGAVLTVGLLSVFTMALPAQAGLGDLLDALLDPVDDIPIVGDIVSPVVEGVLDPLVDEVVDPIAGALVDPIVDQVVAPIVAPVVETVVAPVIETVVAPVVEEAPVPVAGDGAPPIVEEVLPPVQGTDPIQGTTPTVPMLGSAAQTDDSRPLGVSASSDVAQSWYSNGTVARGSAPDTVAIKGIATGVQSLKVASALQTALVASGAPFIPNSASEPLAVRPVSDFRLDGLTNWLRTDGLRNLLALPVRLLDLLARALLTAGSGLVAPLSMLLALTAYLIKDRRWVGPHTSQIERASARDGGPGGPDVEGMARRRPHLELDDDGLHQSSRRVFSAAIRKRLMTSPHTCSMYAATRWAP